MSELKGALIIGQSGGPTAVINSSALGVAASTSTRSPCSSAVFRLIEEVCKPFFGTAEAHYTVSAAAGSAGAYERALAEAQRALELRPKTADTTLLRLLNNSADTLIERLETERCRFE